jgi:hypothetical protein
MGYKVKETHDFETATHPQERMCWDIACNAFEIITGDSPDLYADWLEDDNLAICDNCSNVIYKTGDDEDSDIENTSNSDWVKKDEMLQNKMLRFEEIQSKRLPAGTYDAFISNRGVYYEGYSRTATITIGQWEVYGEITRIHRYRFLGKYKVSFDKLEYQISLLKRVVEKLNKGVKPDNLPKFAKSAKQWKSIRKWLDNSWPGKNS